MMKWLGGVFRVLGVVLGALVYVRGAAVVVEVLVWELVLVLVQVVVAELAMVDVPVVVADVATDGFKEVFKWLKVQDN